MCRWSDSNRWQNGKPRNARLFLCAGNACGRGFAFPAAPGDRFVEAGNLRSHGGGKRLAIGIVRYLHGGQVGEQLFVDGGEE